MVLAVAAVLSGCAGGAFSFNKPDPLEAKVDTLSKKVDHTNKVVENRGQLKLDKRVRDLSKQVRDLRGQVQQLEHSLKQSNQRQRDLYQDLDRRLQAQSGAGDSADSDKASAPKTAYHHALELLRQSHYEAAEKAFTSFLAQYPKGDLADNAQYWLGESRYVSQNFDGAIKAFKAVANDYPNSPKVPGALLKLGYSYAATSHWKDARTALNKVVKHFPNGTEARLARERLSALKKQGH